ncbi:MAG: hypothetical protein DMF90_28720 [Acidobacteria bacterium]|nr:MAG: hypothetical protein DMF90_28720 [Acidobacteriota bacterium]
MPRSFDLRVGECVEHLPIRFCRKLLHDRACGPRGWTGRRGGLGPGFRWIYPASEEGFEARVDARSPQALLDERIEAERREMALIKDDRVAERNRLCVVRIFGEQVEERGRSLPVSDIPRHQGVSIQEGGSTVRPGHLGGSII